MIPQKTQQPGGMVESPKAYGTPGSSSLLAHLSLPFQPQTGDFLRMIGFHVVQGVEIDKLDPWDYFTMAKRARLPDTSAFKKSGQKDLVGNGTTVTHPTYTLKFGTPRTTVFGWILTAGPTT